MHPELKKNPLGFWEVINKPSSEALKEYYAKKYYQQSLGSYEASYTEDELTYFETKLAQKFYVINQLFAEDVSHVKTLLDVGCGEGYALSFFKKHGWNVKGIDFSAAGVTSKNPDCMENLVTGDVFELLHQEILSGHTYQLVWLQNVLEHVVDPLDLLASLKKVLRPDGIAVVTVPNDFSVTQLTALQKTHIQQPFWVALPDHLNYYDYDSLKTTVTSTGWDPLEIIADFPVDWFLFNPASNYVTNPAVGKSAHIARVQIENYIQLQPAEDVIAFWSAMAKVGVGRDLTIFLRARPLSEA